METTRDRDSMVAVRAAISEGRIADGEALCAEFLAENPGDSEATVLLAVVAIKSRKTFLAEPILNRLLERFPKDVEAMVWLAHIYTETLRWAQGKELLNRVLEIEPNSVLALTSLADCLLKEWKDEEAEQLIEKALAVEPDDALALNSKGVLKFHEGHDREAESLFRRAIVSDPNETAPYANLGRLLVCRGAMSEAEAIFDQALNRFWDRTSKLVDFAEVSWMRGNLDSCGRALERAVELEPHVTPTRRNLGRLLIEQGEFQRAAAEYRKAIEIDPEVAILYQEFTLSGKFREEDRHLIEKIRSLARLPQYNLADRQNLQYALGKAYDDLGDHRHAMEHFDEANGIGRMIYAKRPFDRQAHTRLVDSATDTFTTSFYKKHRDLGNESDRPIFIIGMIRSGTTLTDQIVTNHPLVGGAGELTYLLDHEREAFDPTHEPDSDRIARWAKGYLNRLRVTTPGYPRVTDKLPTNFMIAGLIHLAFPNARFIHCRRSALDTCLSIYVTPSIAPYANSFSDIAFYYREYVRLMAHWRRVLPANRLFEVDYEEMVADREPIVRKLMDFLDLPWDDGLLVHQENRGAVATPSTWQARQPIYKTSVERWRRYEPWIGDLLKEFPSLATTS